MSPGIIFAICTIKFCDIEVKADIVQILAWPRPQADRNIKKAEQKVEQNHVCPLCPFFYLLKFLFETNKKKSSNMEHCFSWGRYRLRHAHQSFSSSHFSNCSTMPSVAMHLFDCQFMEMVWLCPASCWRECITVEVEDKPTQLARSPLWLHTSKNWYEVIASHWKSMSPLLQATFPNMCNWKCNYSVSFFNSVSSKQTWLCHVTLNCIFFICSLGLNTLVTLPSLNYC